MSFYNRGYDYYDCYGGNDDYDNRKWIHRAKNVDVDGIAKFRDSKYTLDGFPIRKLLISNIPATATHKELKTIFSRYGKIEDCILKRKKSDYKFFAFITYNSIEDAARAIDSGYNRNISLEGQYLRVLPANSWHQPDYVENTKIFEKILNPDENEAVDCETDAVVIEDTLIHKLNNDCLIHIFTFLPITDRVRIERVCKRWMAVSLESWKLYKKLDLIPYNWWNIKNSHRDYLDATKYLNISSDHSYCNEIRLQKPSITTPILLKVLHRCGQFLNTIDLSFNCGTLKNRKTLIAVFKLCPKIQSINIRNMTLSLPELKALAFNCNHIKSLKLCNNIINEEQLKYNKELTNLILRNRRIECFEIDFCDDNKYILHLRNEFIREISLCFVNISNTPVWHTDVSTETQGHQKNKKKKNNPVVKAHQKFCKLRKLQIRLPDDASSIDFKSIQTLLDANLKSLEVLEIISSKFSFIEDEITFTENILNVSNSIEKLNNLKTLNLDCACFSNREFITSIANGCKQLLRLSIKLSDVFEDVEDTCLIYALASLPKLEYVHLENLNITDEIFGHMPNLKTLHCINCHKMKSPGFIRLLQMSDNVELLNVTECRNIFNDLISAANEIIKNRSKCKILTIIANNTEIDVNEITEPMPFIKVIKISSYEKTFFF